jgi:hypothetical protein
MLSKITLMKKGSFLFVFLLILVGSSCKNSENNTAEDLAPQESITKIIVRRGSFHNDKFVVQDSIIKFMPLDSGFIEEFPQYTIPSQTVVSKEQLENLFKQIQDQGFFDLNARYTSSTTINSMLEVTVETASEKKTVLSEDFENGCPEVLRFIEQEVVRLHGKNLKRQLLPS